MDLKEDGSNKNIHRRFRKMNSKYGGWISIRCVFRIEANWRIERGKAVVEVTRSSLQLFIDRTRNLGHW